jgi:ABC-type nickel/cobalt efflux system permease component RcnA
MRRVVTWAAFAVVLGLAFIWFSGGFSQLGAWAAGQQRAFQNTIAKALRGVGAGDAGAILALVSACFVYGLAHAAGPGHGKVLIGGYGVARKVPMLRLSLIALTASLGQAVTATLLVYSGVLILNLTRQTMIGVTEQVFAPVSYAAIVAIGLWLMWRGMRRFRRGAAPQVHAASEIGEVCASCGHSHGPTLAQVDKAKSLREGLALIAGIAIRPCTGALFVLIITWQMGIAMIGILGAFAMAIGTAVITISVGLAATGLRGSILAGITGSARSAQITAAVEMIAGCFVVVLAGGLLLRVI